MSSLAYAAVVCIHASKQDQPGGPAERPVATATHINTPSDCLSALLSH